MITFRGVAIGVAAGALALGLSAQGARALPALQLGPGSEGSWTYYASPPHGGSTNTWVNTAEPDYSISAYANATAADGGNGDYAWSGTSLPKYGYLVAAAWPDPGSGGGDVLNLGVYADAARTMALTLVASGYGAPPLEDSNDLPSHGIYDTYFEIYEFLFDGSLVDIGNTQPGGTGTGKGYTEEFFITEGAGTSPIVHFDLFTVDRCPGKTMGVENTCSNESRYDPSTAPIDNKLVNANAPFSHDAESWPACEAGFDGQPCTEVPEPMTLALFGAGLLGLGIIRRRKYAA